MMNTALILIDLTKRLCYNSHELMGQNGNIPINNKHKLVLTFSPAKYTQFECFTQSQQ